MHSSAQGEGWIYRAELHVCSHRPCGMPAVRLLSSHRQHSELPLHSQVPSSSLSRVTFSASLVTNPTSLSLCCVCSYLPWFEVFYKLLNNLADYLAKAQVRTELDKPLDVRRSIPTSTFCLLPGEWDESAPGCALPAVHTFGWWVRHSADGNSLNYPVPSRRNSFGVCSVGGIACCVFIFPRERRCWWAQSCPILLDTQRGWVPQEFMWPPSRYQP